MANWVVPNEGKTILLDNALSTAGEAAAENYTLKLYQNNYTPVDGSTSSNFTEATFTGYSSQSITHGSFSASTITSNIASTTAGSFNFTCTGGSSQTIYGAYIVGATSGKVYFAVLFDNPRTMTAGATETVTVTIENKTFA